MITSMARPLFVVTGGNEPEPQHERDHSNPDQLPPPPQRVPAKTLRASAGLFEDMTEEDDGRGYEDEPESKLHALVKHLRADGDAVAAAAGRTAPCTLTLAFQDPVRQIERATERRVLAGAR